MSVSRLVLWLSAAVTLAAQTGDPAYAPLERAYAALREKNYDAAISSFQKAIQFAPDRAVVRKDLAYTYLKAGETLLARDSFAEGMRLDPKDDHVALEYAFLAYETKQQAAARRIFDRVRRKGNPAAEQAFQNIDQPLAAGIQRWSRAVEMEPGKWSGHEELARLAEQRDELELAATHYEEARRLRPDLSAFLLDLGRIWQQQGKDAKALAALLAASRGTESRVAESARELLPKRYPYVYEFEAALALDERNVLFTPRVGLSAARDGQEG